MTTTTDAEMIAELERTRVLCQSWHDDAVSTQKMLMEANETNARLRAANAALVEAAGPLIGKMTAADLLKYEGHGGAIYVFLSDLRALSRAVEAAHE